MTKIIIIGAGPAGTAAALKAAEAGWETVLVEKDKLGGTCLQRGCIPTKALLEESHIVKQARSKHGLLEVNEVEIHQRTRQIVDELTQSLTRQINSKKITVLQGEARFIDEQSIIVNDTIHSADFFLIATGSRDRVFDFPGNAKLWLSEDALTTPLQSNRNLLLIGGGVIGIELAAYYNDLGHRVTILEKEARILPSAPKELAQSIATDFKKEGIRILTGVTIHSITQNIDYQVTFNDTVEHFDHVLLCAGRVPNTSTLGLDKIGLSHTSGLITVDECYQTNLPKIFAVGDARCRVQLAHVATRQAIDVMEFLIYGKIPQPFHTPFVIYTPVQAAWIGATEAQLIANQIEYRSIRQPLGALAKQKIKSDGRRYVSLLVDPSNHILGVSLYMSEAGEFLPFFGLLMEMKIPLDQAKSLVFPHPTLSEAIGEIAAIL